MASHDLDSPTVAFITLGCAKNEVDTARMRERVVTAGFSLVSDPEQADAIVINTCSFIQAATEESLEAVFEAAHLDSVQHGNSVVVVAGCMPSRYGHDLKNELTEATAFVSCDDEEHIAEVLADALGIEQSALLPQQCNLNQYNAVTADGETHAYVKISEGCNRGCTFCTIPSIRGNYHSFLFEEIDQEVLKAQERGVREIVLIAQDTGRWGDDFSEPSTLASLVSRLAKRHPQLWFRVMYIQPEGMTDELIEVVATHDNVCSYFDIPIQHVSARLLKRMNRTGSANSFRELARRIRVRIPDVVLRTTLIVGFPGETDEEFDELLNFVDEGIFDYVGVFAYSREEGTGAARLSGQLPDEVKDQRAALLREAGDRIGALKVSERIGSLADVLICGREEDGQLFGRMQSQAPEVDGCVYLDGGTIGSIARVRITDSAFYEMEGELL